MAKNNNYWTRRAEKRLTEAEKYSEEYIRQAKKIYNSARQKVQKEIENVYKNYAKEVGLSVPELKKVLSKAETTKTWQELQKQGLEQYIQKNYKSRITRLEQIQAQIYAKIKEITPKETALNTQLYKNILQNSYYSNIYDVQSGLGLYFNFKKIDDNLVNLLLTERWSGKNYGQRIWGNTEILAETLSTELGGALISGTSLEKVTNTIQKRFDVAKYYAERLIRTETNHFHNEADYESYKAMGVEEYVFVATLDNRTSAICQELDGKRFKLEDKQEGVNHPPMHPNCRSTTRAYVDDIAEKMLERRAKDPLTGETYTVGNMTYKEWWERYGECSNKTLTNNKTDSKMKIRISGALNAGSPEANKHAKQYYEAVRKMKNDCAVIAKRTGFSEQYVNEVKEHLFMKKHRLSDGVNYFSPDYDIAQSWQRLLDENRALKECDIILLKHEHAELEYMKKGLTQEEAHLKASKRYNFVEALEKGK